MIVRDAYAGLFSSSAWWHSSGLNGSRDCDLPVGTPLMRILDHLMLALALGVVLANRVPMMAAMWLAAGSRTLSDVLVSPVRMRFPLAVHLAAMRRTAEWDEVARSLLMFLQIVSTGGRSLAARFQWARSTTVTIPAITPTFSSTSRPAASPEVPHDISSGHVPLGSHIIHPRVPLSRPMPRDPVSRPRWVRL